MLAIAGPASAGSPGSPAAWVSWLKIVLGALCLIIGVKLIGDAIGALSG